jgi:hypothetical protein
MTNQKLQIHNLQFFKDRVLAPREHGSVSWLHDDHAILSTRQAALIETVLWIREGMRCRYFSREGGTELLRSLHQDVVHASDTGSMVSTEPEHIAFIKSASEDRWPTGDDPLSEVPASAACLPSAFQELLLLRTPFTRSRSEHFTAALHFTNDAEWSHILETVPDPQSLVSTNSWNEEGDAELPWLSPDMVFLGFLETLAGFYEIHWYLEGMKPSLVPGEGFRTDFNVEAARNAADLSIWRLIQKPSVTDRVSQLVAKLSEAIRREINDFDEAGLQLCVRHEIMYWSARGIIREKATRRHKRPQVESAQAEP